MISRIGRAFVALRELPRTESIMLLNTLIGCVGFGLYTAAGVIYYTTYAGVSAIQIGAAFSATAAVWLVAAARIGRVVDRIGPREATIGFGVAQGLLLACIPLVHGFAGIVALLSVLGIAERGASVAREALLAQVVTPERRVVTAARSRSLANVGLAVGNALAGVVLTVGSRTAFVVLLATYAVLTLLVAVISLRYPAVPGRPRGPGRRGILRDPPYLAVAVLAGLISIYNTALVVGLPLWIVGHTDAPRWLFAVLMIVNTTLVIVLQVRATRGAESVPGARRALAQGGVGAAVSCLLFGLAAWIPLWGTVAVLLTGVLVLTAGELRAAAAEWTLRYELADPDAQGEYGSIFSIGATVRSVAGPVLVTFLIGTWLVGGWMALTVLFALLTIATGPVVGWAVRTRAAHGTTERSSASAG